MLNLTCPHCQSEFTFAEVPPGTPVRCRSCKQSFETPAGKGGTAVTPENIFGPGSAAFAAAAAAQKERTPEPAPVPKPVAEPMPVAPRAEVEPAPALPKSARGPLIAEAADLCPKCGLTSVKANRSGPPGWLSHLIGLLALVALRFAMPGSTGIGVGVGVWVLSYIILNVGLRGTPGFRCTTCGHSWK